MIKEKRKHGVVESLFMASVVMVLAIMLSSCRLVPAEKKLNVDAFMDDVVTKMESLKNYDATYTIDEKTTDGVLDRTTAGAVTNYNNTQKHYVTEVTDKVGTEISTKIEVYSHPGQNKKITSYVRITGAQKGLWLTTDSDKEIFDTAQDSVNSFIAALKKLTNPVQVTDTESDVDTYVIKAKLSNANTPNYFERKESVADETNGLELTFYINKVSKYIDKVVAEGSKTLKYTPAKKVNYSLEIKFSNINKVTEVAVPKAVTDNAHYVEGYSEEYSI